MSVPRVEIVASLPAAPGALPSWRQGSVSAAKDFWPSSLRFELADGAACASTARERRILSCSNLPFPVWPGDDDPPPSNVGCVGGGAMLQPDAGHAPWMLSESAVTRCQPPPSGSASPPPSPRQPLPRLRSPPPPPASPTVEPSPAAWSPASSSLVSAGLVLWCSVLVLGGAAWAACWFVLSFWNRRCRKPAVEDQRRLCEPTLSGEEDVSDPGL